MTQREQADKFNAYARYRRWCCNKAKEILGEFVSLAGVWVTQLRFAAKKEVVAVNPRNEAFYSFT